MKKEWRKITYEDQDYPLNFISTDFLKGLNENGFNDYKISEITPKMLFVVDHISTMILIAHVYLYMKDGNISIRFVIFGVSLFICMLISLIILTKGSKLRHLRMMVIVYFVIQLFQPVLQTLTVSFSDDTVYALVFLISIMNIFTQDYSLKRVGGIHMKDVDVIPMNCLLLALIMLASRFESSKMASIYLQFAIVTFSTLPILKQHIMESKNNVLIYGFTSIIVLITCCTINKIIIHVYVSGLVVIMLIMPLIYIHSQRYKRNVSGPWNPDQVVKGNKRISLY